MAAWTELSRRSRSSPGQPARVVLILGAANLVADGFSMAASNFLGTRAERDDYRRLELVEERHIEMAPEGEREEIRQIYAEKGFAGNEAERGGWRSSRWQYAGGNKTARCGS